MNIFLAALLCVAIWALAQWTERNTDKIRLWLKRKAFQKRLKNQLKDFKDSENCPCELCSSQDSKNQNHEKLD
jgi:glycerol-3-phosphate dehydrogenase